ncbi:MAG TPA: beta-galactosidase [Solirubrobacterales bacterium]|nr:beta-galactosidase [Solirubrobacterales bacterium]
MSGARRGCGVALAVLALCFAAAPGRSAAAPTGFFGVASSANLVRGDFAKMGKLGLTLRVPLNWFEVEPQRGVYDFSGFDRTVAEAAKAKVRLLPFVTGSPAWMAGDASVPPLGKSRAAAWSEFLRRLVDRYGPRGSFWAERGSKQPIRRWQIWNEPNFRIFWHPRPSPRAYVDLLHRSARVIRDADPGATVVAAGLAPVEGGLFPWEFLRRMYRVPGARQAFDVMAIHPYSTSLGALEYELRAMRKAMARAGDGAKPLLVTELGVASDGAYPNPFDKGLRGQARFLRRAYDLMLEHRRRWRLAGAYWFTWRDTMAPDPHCVFCGFAGLYDARGEPKPAWWALTRTVRRAGGAGVR